MQQDEKVNLKLEEGYERKLNKDGLIQVKLAGIALQGTCDTCVEVFGNNELEIISYTCLFLNRCPCPLCCRYLTVRAH